MFIKKINKKNLAIIKSINENGYCVIKNFLDKKYSKNFKITEDHTHSS